MSAEVRYYIFIFYIQEGTVIRAFFLHSTRHLRNPLFYNLLTTRYDYRYYSPGAVPYNSSVSIRIISSLTDTFSYTSFSAPFILKFLLYISVSASIQLTC